MTTAKKPRKRRETPEQKARRVGKGLGLYLLPADGGWEIWRRDDGGHFYFNGFAGGTAIALWRALARARNVRL